jgi:MoaA/NifB/PqqE/SkfB family radical SAM enzyme/SAM-dependent methyltransferase
MPMNDQLYVERRDGYCLVLDPMAPNWLATTEDGAWVLRHLRAGVSPDEVSYRYARRASISLRRALRLVGRLADEAADFASPPACAPYRGRADYLEPERLREVWLHLTDRCNLACRHCLVSSGPLGEDGMPPDLLDSIIRQACSLGADTFYFTGGEPLLRRDIVRVLRQVTCDYGATAVVLTNGTLLDDEITSRFAELPPHRLFLQVSLDGSSAQRNDAIRSPGSFEAAVRGIRAAIAAGLNVTVATVVLRRNLDDLGSLAALVHALGVRHLHLMWQHVRERGARLPRAATRSLIAAVSSLARRAQPLDLVIDNIENMRRTVNGDPNIKYDLSNACWDSLAVYRDGRIFPSACLVGIESQCAGLLPDSSLKQVWLDSDLFSTWRRRSVIYSHAPDGDPLLFLHGGGDPEHAFFASDRSGDVGLDPYLPLHRAMAKAVIDRTVAPRRALLGPHPSPLAVYHIMGEDGYGCPTEAGVRNGGDHKVDFVHSNCVLIQDVIAKSRSQVRDYYGEAAREPKTDICSPVAIDQRYLSHIPEEVVARSYGCGSPVFAADLKPGETLLDLGSGAGLECFIASRLLGPDGRVVGIDMTRDMLHFANDMKAEVVDQLGYDNVHFQPGLLEALPIADQRAHAVISNCVINLSPEKLKVFSEIRRVLKPGGRLVISDIVSQTELPPEIRFNPRLRGECIAGALTEKKLVRTLEKLGFVGIQVLQKAAWRTVDDVEFDSLTLRAWKPAPQPAVRYTYPGPYPAVTLESGQELIRGVPTEVVPSLLLPARDGDRLFGPRPTAAAAPKRNQDCMVCGAPLVYLEAEEELSCHYCHRVLPANARCQRGHFVCDGCHTEDHLAFIKHFCSHTDETDPVAIFSAMRSSHLFPLHGPEHHALVPAAFLTAYRNRFGGIPQTRIDAAIDRGSGLPGGTCAYWGGCAAALGIGIAYSAILQVSPLSREPRGIVQTVVSRVLARLGAFASARCCRRESYLSLQAGCDLSSRYLPNALEIGPVPSCDQTALNRECLGPGCSFHPAHGR